MSGRRGSPGARLASTGARLASTGTRLASTGTRIWRLVRPVLTLVIFGVVTACSGDGPPSGPPGPDVGRMEVRVPEAPSDAGILVLELTGSRSGAVEPVAPATIWSSDAAASRVILVIRGGALPGPVARFSSPDRRGSYSVRVLEAAAGRSREYAVLDTAGFRARVVPVN